MESRKRILFIPEGVTNAHVTRSLVLAKGLDTKSYDILFAAAESYRGFIEKEGFSFQSLVTLPPQEFIDRLDRGQMPYTYERLKEYVQAEITLLKQFKPDLVVGDFRISLGVSSVIAGVKYINLVNATWSPFYQGKLVISDIPITRVLGPEFIQMLMNSCKPFFLGILASSFNRLRQFYGLSNIGDLRHVYCFGTYTCYLDVPSLFPSLALPENHLYIGPILYQPSCPLPPWWESLPKDKPLIYVSFGSSGDEGLYDTIVEALKDMPVVVCISTAGRWKNYKSTADNIFVSDYLPGVDMCKRASLFISNGGSGSVYQALLSGVPILGLPRNMDQFLIMQRLKETGTGLFLRKKQSSSYIIREAVEKILKDENFRQNSLKFSTDIKTWDTCRNFREFIDKAAQ